MTRALRAAGLLAGLLPILSGCGGGEDEGEDGAPAAAPSAAERPRAEAAPDGAGPDRERHFDSGRSLHGPVSTLGGQESELRTRVTATEVIVELPADVLFEFDRADLQPEAEPSLRRLAELIQDHPQGLISINGHTDALGSDVYNQALSEQRAQAVADWLAGTGGIDAARLRTAGFGKTRPVPPNARADGSDDPEGRQRNRRVEVILPRGG
jgi:outer membrane protein OmpA-like peptidoglycan-associated protein